MIRTIQHIIEELLQNVSELHSQSKLTEIRALDEICF
jgi:hypothetical protein